MELTIQRRERCQGVFALAFIAAALLLAWVARAGECPALADIPAAGSCSFSDAGVPSCAPGEVRAAILAMTDAQQHAELCRKGGTQESRCHPSRAMRKAIFAAYGLKWPPPPPRPDGEASYEIDHRIEESLGGAQTWANLWPQFLPQKQWKDRLETQLHADFCAHRISLAAAHRVLLDPANWRAKERR